MGTTADKLQAVLNSKRAIKEALIAKGAAVTDQTKFSQYAAVISQMSTGSGEADTSAFEAEMKAIIGEGANIPPVLVSGMKFYKCAYVDATNKTWSGYELVLQDGVYVVSDVLTENLKYTFITPTVESYYSEDGLLQLKDFYNGIVLVSPTDMTSAENDEWVISADSEYGSEQASFIAFSGSDIEEYGWVSGDQMRLPHWIQWQNKQKNVKITEYAMQVNGWVTLSNRERFPCSWELQGSINGNDWVSVDSRTDAFSSADELKTWEYYTFTCQNPGYYSFYRIYVTGVVDRNESEYVYIGQIKAYGQFE